MARPKLPPGAHRQDVEDAGKGRNWNTVAKLLEMAEAGSARVSSSATGSRSVKFQIAMRHVSVRAVLLGAARARWTLWNKAEGTATG